MGHPVVVWNSVQDIPPTTYESQTMTYHVPCPTLGNGWNRYDESRDCYHGELELASKARKLSTLAFILYLELSLFSLSSLPILLLKLVFISYTWRVENTKEFFLALCSFLNPAHYHEENIKRVNNNSFLLCSPLRKQVQRTALCFTNAVFVKWHVTEYITLPLTMICNSLILLYLFQ